MKILNGVDIIIVERVKEAYHRRGMAFLSKIFTDLELAYCQKKGSADGYRFTSLAARFAAKEAVAKAFRVGLLGEQGLGYKNIEVQNDTQGYPKIILKNKAKALAENLQVSDISISLSHEKNVAIASCCLLLEED